MVELSPPRAIFLPNQVYPAQICPTRDKKIFLENEKNSMIWASKKPIFWLFFGSKTPKSPNVTPKWVSFVNINKLTTYEHDWPCVMAYLRFLEPKKGKNRLFDRFWAIWVSDFGKPRSRSGQLPPTPNSKISETAITRLEWTQTIILRDRNMYQRVLRRLIKNSRGGGYFDRTFHYAGKLLHTHIYIMDLLVAPLLNFKT